MSEEPQKQKTAGVVEATARKLKGTLYLDLGGHLCMDPNELIEKYEGQVVLQAEGSRYAVGKVRYYVVRIDEMKNRGISPMMAMDGLSGVTAAFCSLFTDTEEDEAWARTVYVTFPEATFGDLLIVDWLFVNPPFRGKKVGLHCIEMLRRIVGGMGLVGLDASVERNCPEYDERPSDTANAAETPARRRLVAYFETVGFRTLWGEDFMALDPRANNPRAEWEDGEGDMCFQRTEGIEKFRLKQPDGSKGEG